MVRRKGIPVLVWFTEEEYSRLSIEARRSGYATVGDYVRELVLRALEASSGEAGHPQANAKVIADVIAKRLERLVADLINPFTAKVDEVNRKVAELLEAVESMKPEVEAEQPTPPPTPRPAKQQMRRAPSRPSGMERLHEEGVVFEADLQWLRDPERFFAKLKSSGAKVINLRGEKVAVDPEFWEEFKARVEEIGVRDLAEAAVLVRTEFGGDKGARAARLLEKLAKAGIAYYDEELGHWVVEEEG